MPPRCPLLASSPTNGEPSPVVKSLPARLAQLAWPRVRAQAGVAGCVSKVGATPPMGRKLVLVLAAALLGLASTRRPAPPRGHCVLQLIGERRRPGGATTPRTKPSAEIAQRSRVLERRLCAEVPAVKPHLGQSKGEETPWLARQDLIGDFALI